MDGRDLIPPTIEWRDGAVRMIDQRRLPDELAFVEQYKLKASGNRVMVLGEGRLINLAAAEGHPASVMDMSFANQALSAEFMVKKGRTLDRKVHVVPREIDLEIARLKLASMAVAIDELTTEQSSYLSSWRHGT